MLLGCVSSAYNQVRRHTERIKNIKVKHNFYGEIKWSNVSTSQYKFYKELLEYFFDTDLRYRAVIVDKPMVNIEDYNGDYDTFYYKMYYYMLNHNKNSLYSYNVYLDIKDTLSANKVNKLNGILNTEYGVFRNVQNIHSRESLLMQIADLITGALAYNLNISDKRVRAKVDLIKLLEKHAFNGLTRNSDYSDKKLNLFFIELK